MIEDPATTVCHAEVDARHITRVLVVEDDLMLRKVLVKILEKRGYLAETASDGVEAVLAHDQRAFDVILMDCQMPRLDGFKAACAIRSAELSTGKHVAIIALTAMLGTRAQCLEAGMDEYLNKPVNPGQLDEAIRKALSKNT